MLQSASQADEKLTIANILEGTHPASLDPPAETCKELLTIFRNYAMEQGDMVHSLDVSGGEGVGL